MRLRCKYMRYNQSILSCYIRNNHNYSCNNNHSINYYNYSLNNHNYSCNHNHSINYYNYSLNNYYNHNKTRCRKLLQQYR